MCYYCENFFESADTLHNHITAYHQSAEALQCEECDLTCTSGGELQHHTNLVHMSSTLNESKAAAQATNTCTFCSFNVPSVDKLQDHVDSQHGEARRHMCYRCDITFESYGELKNHSKVTHPLEFSLPHMDQHQDVIPIERYADPTDPNNGEPSSATSAPVMQEYSNPEIQAASTTLAVDAASRTLGFWPLPTSESTTTEHPITVPLPTPSSLLKCLEVFLGQIFSIPL